MADTVKACVGSAPPTQTMASVGLSWDGILDVGQHVINLLESQGQLALGIVDNLVKMVAAVSGRDFLTVFALLNQTVVDVQALIAAIKAEFGL